MTQLSKVKQNIHQHKDKSWNLEKHKKTNSRPNWAVWTVSVNCAHWRGSTLAIYKTVQMIFPLNLQTITITLNVVKWRWRGEIYRNFAEFYPDYMTYYFCLPFIKCAKICNVMQRQAAHQFLATTVKTHAYFNNYYDNFLVIHLR